MAHHNRVFALSLAAFLLFAAANASAHGAETTVHGLTVAGQLCCTSTGNCPGQGVGAAAVELRCLAGRRTRKFGEATTNSIGSFNITAPAKDGILCGVIAHLPLDAADCGELSAANGVLVSGLLPAGTVATSALGLVRSATLAGFKKYSGI